MLEIEEVNVVKYKGANGDLYDSKKDAVKSLVYERLENILPSGMDWDDYADILISSRKLVIQLLQEYEDAVAEENDRLDNLC